MLRVEDVDPSRSRPEHERRQLLDLRWLGLDWDEGPDVGGRHGPYRQSERRALYEAALGRLDTYPCTCTRRELRLATLAPHGDEPVYPGTCREGRRIPGRRAALRWRVPDASITVVDALQGAVTQDLRTEVGDFVLRRGDGAFAYQLAVVVDDLAMEITDVLRGADLLGSAPRQVALARALGAEPPRFAHVPLLLGPAAEKLSKRHGAPDLSALRESGADPRAVVAALARSVGLLASDVERVAPRELVAGFLLESIEARPERLP